MLYILLLYYLLTFCTIALQKKSELQGNPKLPHLTRQNVPCD